MIVPTILNLPSGRQIQGDDALALAELLNRGREAQRQADHARDLLWRALDLVTYGEGEEDSWSRWAGQTENWLLSKGYPASKGGGDALVKREES